MLVARLGTAYYKYPNLLSYKLYQRAGSYFTNHRGQQEKYLGGVVSAFGYRDPNGYWCYLLPTGHFYEYTPPYSRRVLTGSLVERLDRALYNDPAPLLTNRVQIP
ncbi:MAG: hypothetical protein M3463_05555 [Verrucomicrobiota bacterium]|nr:hypothetical protein [Verrucomicrobiota bacterium]